MSARALADRAAHALRGDADADAALQAELVRRVMALDGREQELRLRNAELETAVDALDECTGVSRADILGISRELVRERTGADGSVIGVAPRTRRLCALAGAVCIGAVALALALDGSEPPPLDEGIGAQVQERYLSQARLSAAMADVLPVRMMVLQHAMTYGTFPSSLEELRLEEDALRSRHVAGVELETGGVIVARLPDDLGGDKRLRLVPELVMGGMSVDWTCQVNLPASVLPHIGCETG